MGADDKLSSSLARSLELEGDDSDGNDVPYGWSMICEL